MTTPTNRRSYIDIYETYDKALEDPKGIRLPFDTFAEAKRYQLRMFVGRKIDRSENKKAYPPEHPMHGQSEYDQLQVTLREADDGTWFVYVEPRDKFTPQPESLSELEAEDETPT